MGFGCPSFALQATEDKQVSGVRTNVGRVKKQILQPGPEAKRRTGEKRTAEPKNNEPQNVEGWFRFAQSFKK
jgi:hypothetical protein